jgi:hypothetical protein
VNLALGAVCASLLLSSPSEPPPTGTPDAPPEAICVRAKLDAGLRLSGDIPDIGLGPRFELSRTTAGFGLQLDRAAGVEVEFDMVRTGGAASYLGVEGEAFVPRLRLLQVHGSWARGGLGISAGLIGNLWSSEANRGHGFRFVAPSVGEELGFFFRSDLGLRVSWVSPKRFAHLSLAVQSGEGGDRRERNSGKNLSFLAVLRPLALLDESLGGRLEFGVLARDGSVTSGVVRDHRGAFFVRGDIGPVRLGIEGLKAWGLQGEGQREPLALSLWASYEGALPLRAFGRLDLFSDDPSDPAFGSLQARTFVGLPIPFKGDRRPLTVGIEHLLRHAGEQSQALAGAEGLQTSHTISLHVHGRLHVAAKVAALPSPAKPDKEKRQ